jgi:DHA2 family multidrug resistance protein
VLAHREQFHQIRLAEHAIPSSVQYQDTLQQVTSYFTAHESSLAQAQQQAVAWIVKLCRRKRRSGPMSKSTGC